MARPLRIEYAGALYHVTSRGNAQADIYADKIDREQFLTLLHHVNNRFDWYCHAYCLMDNHYHLLIETGNANLSKGMKVLNGSYTQYFNRQHKRVGHVFQGRFKAIIVQKDSYLLELSRYIVLNPVRAEMIRQPKDWPWSSYRATAGLTDAHPCLTTDWILAGFGRTKARATENYCAFVKEGRNQPSVWQQLRNQIYLGDDEFIDDMQCKINPAQSLQGIPRKQKLAPPKSIAHYQQTYKDRDLAMAQAYLSGHHTLAAIGDYFDVSASTVGRAVRLFEQ